jgi:hypothetical protein
VTELTASIPAKSTASIPLKATLSIPAEVALGGRGDCGGSDSHCITCSDEGVAMRVLELRDACAICCDERGDSHEVAVDLVSPVAVADELLVHAGVAIGHLGPQR